MFAPDVNTWAQQVAAKLRYVQADFTGMEKTQRQGFLTEEVERAIRDIVPNRRKDYLDALAGCFPLGEASSSLPAPEQQGPELTPEQLLEKLVEMAPLLPKRKVHEFGIKLQQAGYLALETTTLMDAPSPEFLKVFPLGEDKQVDLQRTFRLLQMLGEFYINMDKVAWNIWRAIASKSSLRKDTTPAGDIRTLSSRYLTGDAEVSVAQIGQVVNRLRQLLAGVMTAIGPAGRSIARKQLARYGPDAIRDAANLEAGFFSSIEQKCWRKYTELAKDLNEDAIEGELHEAIARYAEDLMRGTGRTNDS